jgi:hypothetical protein
MTKYAGDASYDCLKPVVSYKGSNLSSAEERMDGKRGRMASKPGIRDMSAGIDTSKSAKNRIGGGGYASKEITKGSSSHSRNTGKSGGKSVKGGKHY